MASNTDQENETVVPTTVLIAFVESALALINSGLAYLPTDELEHVSVHLEHATLLATQEARSRRVGSGTRTTKLTSQAPAAIISHTTPIPTSLNLLSGLEDRVQSLSIKGL